MYANKWLHKNDFILVGMRRWKTFVVVPANFEAEKIVNLLKQDGTWQKIFEEAWKESDVEKIVKEGKFDQKFVNCFLEKIAMKINILVDIFVAQ